MILSELTQLTSSKFGTVYRSMAEAKKGVARIPVPPRKQSKAEDSERQEAVVRSNISWRPNPAESTC